MNETVIKANGKVDKRYLIDTHTHTVVSGHAYNTVFEMVEAASIMGMNTLCLTDHGPLMPGSCNRFYFSNYRVFEGKDFGINVKFGCEANICDVEGNIDITEKSELECINVLIASIHPDHPYTVGSLKDNTKAMINAMKNKKVAIIGHPDNSFVPVDYKEVVNAAKYYGVALEVNNSSLNPRGFRGNPTDNCKKYLELCEKNDVAITLGSDAHCVFDIGNFEYAVKLLDEIKFPQELIINANQERFETLLNIHK